MLGPEYNWLVDLRFAPRTHNSLSDYMMDGDNTVVVALHHKQQVSRETRQTQRRSQSNGVNEVRHRKKRKNNEKTEKKECDSRLVVTRRSKEQLEKGKLQEKLD